MNKYCFLQIAILDKRDNKNKYILYKNDVIIELFYDIIPKTSENFYSLCIGNNVKKLCYKNNKIFRIVKDSFIQSGDVINNDGTDGESIYGKRFNDEFFYDEDGNLDEEKNYLHNEPFLLSMANNGPNTNNSQFIITIEPLPHLDGCNVVFGKIIKGISTLLVINNIPTYVNGKICNDIEIEILNCGDIKDIYNYEEINLEYENSLCNQNLINISNKLKNISKTLKNDKMDYNFIIRKCKNIDKILYNDFKFINDKLIDKYNYYKIKIAACILKVICKYKIEDYKNVIIDTNILLEIPEKYLTDKNKLQILFYKLKSIYEMDSNNEESLIKSKKILEELYFINNNDIKMFMKELKKEEDKINNLLKNIN
jgi:peptidyl-prolyl isomerase D